MHNVYLFHFSIVMKVEMLLIFVGWKQDSFAVCSDTHCLYTHRDLPLLGSVTVKVCRENYNKKKKERSDTDIGTTMYPFSLYLLINVSSLLLLFFGLSFFPLLFLSLISSSSPSSPLCHRKD